MTKIKKNVELDPKDMPETAFIIFYSFRYKEALDYMFFWPEVLNVSAIIIVIVVIIFLTNILFIERIWKKHFVKTKGTKFWRDYYYIF